MSTDVGLQRKPEGYKALLVAASQSAPAVLQPAVDRRGFHRAARPILRLVAPEEAGQRFTRMTALTVQHLVGWQDLNVVCDSGGFRRLDVEDTDSSKQVDVRGLHGGSALVRTLRNKFTSLEASLSNRCAHHRLQKRRLKSVTLQLTISFHPTSICTSSRPVAPSGRSRTTITGATATRTGA